MKTFSTQTQYNWITPATSTQRIRSHFPLASKQSTRSLLLTNFRLMQSNRLCHQRVTSPRGSRGNHAMFPVPSLSAANFDSWKVTDLCRMRLQIWPRALPCYSQQTGYLLPCYLWNKPVARHQWSQMTGLSHHLKTTACTPETSLLQASWWFRILLAWNRTNNFILL